MMIRNMVRNFVIWIIKKGWEKLPLFWRALSQESLFNLGKLDYGNNEIKMNVNSRATFFRLNSCQKEPETVKWIEQFVKPNDVFYDIGSNIGAYSFVAEVVAQGKILIYAFEPGFSTFPTLVNNVFINNRFNTIIPINIALGSASKAALFTYSDLYSGSASHLGVQSIQSEVPNGLFNQLVMVYSLDDFVQKTNIRFPNLIKIDVDGHELEILQGAKSILRSPELRSVQVEVDENNAKEVSAIYGILSGAGFLEYKKNRHKESNIVDCIFEKK
jgi:FkbM family methyltransferase